LIEAERSKLTAKEFTAEIAETAEKRIMLKARDAQNSKSKIRRFLEGSKKRKLFTAETAKSAEKRF
jgi:hypothetical protein